MKLKVDTFLARPKDPQLKKLDDWRATNRYPAVDYHRVTADNSAGQVPDSGRDGHASPRTPSAIAAGKGMEARFSCDALAVRVDPLKEHDTRRWHELRRTICADGPPKQDGIAAGRRKVYYLITDRGFAERGIRSHAGLRPARRRVQVARRRAAASAAAARRRQFTVRGRQRERDGLAVAAGEQRLGLRDPLPDRDRHRVVGEPGVPGEQRQRVAGAGQRSEHRVRVGGVGRPHEQRRRELRSCRWSAGRSRRRCPRR